MKTTYGTDLVTGRRVQVRRSRMAGAVQIRVGFGAWCAVRAATIKLDA